MAEQPGETDDAVLALRRWEDSGAVWKVLSDTEERLTVGLYTCDGGEQVGRIATADPRFRAYVAGRGGQEG